MVGGNISDPGSAVEVVYPSEFSSMVAVCRRAQRVAAGSFIVALFVGAAFGAAKSADAQLPARPTRVLLLYAPAPESPTIAAFSQELRLALRQGSSAPVEFYEEYLDLVRFPEADRSAQLANYYGSKYQNLHIDAIVAVGAQALNFASKRAASAFSGVPIVFALASDVEVDRAALPANVTGRVATVPLGPTLELARRLQPDANLVLLIGGAARADSDAVNSALKSSRLGRDGPDIAVIQAPKLDSLLRAVRRLPRKSIVFLADFTLDADGRRVTSADVVAQLAAESRVPVYGHLENWLGRGIVGGALADPAREGMATAALVLRVLQRQRGEPMPTVDVIPTYPVVDWRAMEHWGLDQRRAPANTDVRFAVPTAWERYRVSILVTLALIIAQLVLIARLLIERRARLEAESEVQQQLAHVAHLLRVATVGRSAKKSDAKLADATEILDAIVADNAMAADVIDRAGATLRRERPRMKRCNLNDACQGAQRLMRSAATVRGATIELELDPTLPAIVGDAPQLQQVVMSLVLNTLEELVPSDVDRAVVVTTRGGAGSVEVSVRNSGQAILAIAPGGRVEPRFSTKKPGLGAGLVIAHSIVERHGGRIDAQSDPSGGAVFQVVLPLKPPRYARVRYAAERDVAASRAGLLYSSRVYGPRRVSSKK